MKVEAVVHISVPTPPEVTARLRAIRAEATQTREALLGFQKACGRDDRDGARFFAEQAAHQMKMQRGADWCLRWIEADPGPNPPLPPEIAPYAAHAYGVADHGLA